MKVSLPVLGAAVLLLGGCQTTDDSQWARIRSGTSFNTAERTCEDQQESIAEEDARPDFFVKCMSALGWSPKSGTGLAQAKSDRDPG